MEDILQIRFAGMVRVGDDLSRGLRDTWDPAQRSAVEVREDGGVNIILSGSVVEVSPHQVLSVERRKPEPKPRNALKALPEAPKPRRRRKTAAKK